MEVISCSLQIVDALGQPMQKKNEWITIWSEIPPSIGDELTLGYEILRPAGRRPDRKQITLKVLCRNMWFPAPNYVSLKIMKSSGAETFHGKAWSLGVWEGGSSVALTCTPIAKNGGRLGVKRLMDHYHNQKKMIYADNQHRLHG